MNKLTGHLLKKKATEDLRNDLLGGGNVHGRGPEPKVGPNADFVEEMSERAPSEEEFRRACDKLKVAEDGAPSVDGIMAWMILSAGAGFKHTLLKLMCNIWNWGVIPACWKIAGESSKFD